MTNLSPSVQNLATHAGALEMRRLTLIGLFGPAHAMQGLLRLPSGKTVTVQTGAQISALGRVVAIDAEGLVIDQNGTLARMPILN